MPKTWLKDIPLEIRRIVYSIYFGYRTISLGILSEVQWLQRDCRRLYLIDQELYAEALLVCKEQTTLRVRTSWNIRSQKPHDIEAVKLLRPGLQHLELQSITPYYDEIELLAEKCQLAKSPLRTLTVGEPFVLPVGFRHTGLLFGLKYAKSIHFQLAALPRSSPASTCTATINADRTMVITGLCTQFIENMARAVIKALRDRQNREAKVIKKLSLIRTWPKRAFIRTIDVPYREGQNTMHAQQRMWARVVNGMNKMQL